MTLLRCLPLVFKQVIRHRLRSGLTVFGVAIAMFLFTTVQAMHRSVARATTETTADTELVVYRADRYCPATSELPEDYLRRIESIEGVTEAVPVKVIVNNCRTSLDVVTFRGVPKETFLSQRRDRWTLLEGSYADWQSRSDAALLGATLAKRRGLSPGMTFDAAGITAYVAGVIASQDAQDQNVAYTELAFTQLAGRDRLGIVTQFNVRVASPDQLDRVAAEIDEQFATAQEPTSTFTEKAFVGRIADDVIELVGFARWLGLGCLAAVFALLGNSIILGVQSRVSEHAVLQTLGFHGVTLGGLIVLEGVLLALLGSVLGAGMALLLADYGSFALSVEGASIPIAAELPLLLQGLLVCMLLGLLGGLFPAWQTARQPIAQALRAQ